MRSRRTMSPAPWAWAAGAPESAADGEQQRNTEGNDDVVDMIVHRIRLRPGVTPDRFETWVRETDYATCPELPSVLSFSVQRVSADPAAPVHFFEVIGVRSLAEFEKDAAGPAFARLVTDFEGMAEVLDELAGVRVEPGYRAAGA
ncbi:RedY protein [Streptomyces sp. NPDC008001]|uniref:RedY protein n=1 Tax=Streptomyces sp. NPDC008001 TaxID=3364804 RepID=UPI0036E084A2